MEIKFTDEAKEDFDYWKTTNNQTILKRIRELLESIQKTPYRGIGKPEKLKYNLRGHWSRRINREHRLIYKLEKDAIIVISLRFHYG